MMSEKRLDAIKSEKKSLTKKQEDLYQRQRTCERLTDGIGSYFRKNQRLMQKTRELFRKNDDSRVFDEVYALFTQDSGQTMMALGDEKRTLKRQQHLLEEQKQALVKEEKKLDSREKLDEH
ncbi:DUF3958 family protein [Enterococcus raffinosus]|uniref:DUF3958 family protein n=1 Tax=Enterococcus raffinosus TaxID=71452 RepID=UPI001C46B781|nr:DUF3958 family protein [Enterococcus raffinosus]MDT2570414.1 DUF3958 family protein [Enterococcus raffinosus]QXJ59682.1 DUF3958 family protein [Enterococcus raffinosus]